jgi:predicted N-acetyltransferase YhbS
VETAAAFRRRGLCGTLAYHAACAALTELGAERLVLVGLPDHTSEIYQSVGFEVRERLVAAFAATRP